MRLILRGKDVGTVDIPSKVPFSKNGSFCEVYKGFWTSASGNEKDVAVAVKRLRRRDGDELDVRSVFRTSRCTGEL